MIWYSLLKANSIWGNNENGGYVPVSINAAQTADYSPFKSEVVNPINPSIILDVIRDLNPDSDTMSANATLTASFSTPIATATPMLNVTPTLSVLTLTPTLGLPTIAPTASLPPILPTNILPSALPTVGTGDIAPTLAPDTNVPPVIPSLIPAITP